MSKYKPSIIIFILFLVAVLMLPSNPVENLPGQDNGVFLYAGQRLLAGDTPYVDFWDHKGPLIFYVNALGLLLGAGSRWGVWLLEYVFLFFAAVGLYEISRLQKWNTVSSSLVLLLGIFL